MKNKIAPSQPAQPRGLLVRIHLDLPLLLALIALCIYGSLVLYSASGQNTVQVEKQLLRWGIAFIFMFALAQVSPQKLRHWSPWIYLLGIALLIAVLLFGSIGKGAQRWLDLGIMRFQPSELVKIAVPMMLAWYFSNHPLPPRIAHLSLSFILLMIPVLLIAKQPDLGTAILVASSGLFILFLAGMSWKLIIALISAAAAAAPLMWQFVLHEYQKKRVLTFLNPEQDPLGAGYHIIQSKIAIGSGGIYGKGWFNGTQSQLEFLPERHTDFIFSVLSEELGLTGVIILLILYALVILRGLYIARQAQDTYSRLLAGALVLVFFVYLFVNIGMVSGLLPVVGVPLPLISYGGTSLVTLLAGFGILMSIHTHRKLLPK